MTTRTPAERVLGFKVLLVVLVVGLVLRHELSRWLLDPEPRSSALADSENGARGGVRALQPATATPRALARAALPQTHLLPGLCPAVGAPQSRATQRERQNALARFRALDLGGAAHVYLDPRLPDAAYQPILHQLEEAEREVVLQLGFEPASPDVFVYFDVALLRATSCTADGVAAYYDGALHVAVTDRDGRQSVMHQYAHHALTSRGLLGPAWAQEGIALLIASESWWREPGWLKQVASTPVDLAAMERDLPETMPKDEAELFSARAAALVSCAAHDHPNGLAGFVEALRVAEARGDLKSRFADLAEPANWSECLDGF